MYEDIDVRLDTFGHQDDAGTIGLAVAQAKDHAIKLLGISGALWPLEDDAFFGHVTEILLSELISFSIQARRVMEVSSMKGINLKGRRWKLIDTEGDVSYETDLWRALNVVLHATRLEVETIQSLPTQVFERLGDRAVVAIKATSPKDGVKHICPSALVYAFLTLRLKD